MTAFAVKVIASLCMLIDHAGVIFDAPFVFRLIGRIAFPVYAYMIAQGCKRTGNINKYLIRLGIFAIISEIPFDLAFYKYLGEPFGVNYFRETNVFYTLFLGTACIAVYENLKTKLLSEADSKAVLFRKALALMATVPIFMLGNILSTDYGMYGVIFILVFYLANPESRPARTAAMFGVVFFKYAYPYFYGLCYAKGIHLFLPPGEMMIFWQNLDQFWFALVAVLLVYLYNGERGPRVKWAFYAFYPVHLAVLAAISVAIAL